MKPTKAYIIRIDNPVSQEYAVQCAESCDRVGLDYEFFEGLYKMSRFDSWNATGIFDPIQSYPRLQRLKRIPDSPAVCASASHAALWNKIANGTEECVAILEHDTIMLHNVDIDIPDNKLVVLGYKLEDKDKYDYQTAGSPVELIDRDNHAGAHAYAITKTTANALVKEIQQNKFPLGLVDNSYFARNEGKPISVKTKTPIAIASPTPAIGWLRESTIWEKSATRNYKFINSFNKNLKGT